MAVIEFIFVEYDSANNVLKTAPSSTNDNNMTSSQFKAIKHPNTFSADWIREYIKEESAIYAENGGQSGYLIVDINRPTTIFVNYNIYLLITNNQFTAQKQAGIHPESVHFLPLSIKKGGQNQVPVCTFEIAGESLNLFYGTGRLGIQNGVVGCPYFNMWRKNSLDNTQSNIIVPLLGGNIVYLTNSSKMAVGMQTSVPVQPITQNKHCYMATGANSYGVTICDANWIAPTGNSDAEYDGKLELYTMGSGKDAQWGLVGAGCFNRDTVGGIVSNVSSGQPNWGSVSTHINKIVTAGSDPFNLGVNVNKFGAFLYASKECDEKSYLNSNGVIAQSALIISPLIVGSHPLTGVSFCQNQRFSINGASKNQKISSGDTGIIYGCLTNSTSESEFLTYIQNDFDFEASAVLESVLPPSQQGTFSVYNNETSAGTNIQNAILADYKDWPSFGYVYSIRIGQTQPLTNLICSYGQASGFPRKTQSYEFKKIFSELLKNYRVTALNIDSFASSNPNFFTKAKKALYGTKLNSFSGIDASQMTTDYDTLGAISIYKISTGDTVIEAMKTYQTQDLGNKIAFPSSTSTPAQTGLFSSIYNNNNLYFEGQDPVDDSNKITIVDENVLWGLGRYYTTVDDPSQTYLNHGTPWILSKQTVTNSKTKNIPFNS